MLGKAPDRVAVAKQFVGNFVPTAWSGSRAAVVESNARLLDDLLVYPDPALAEFVRAEKLRLETIMQQGHDLQGAHREELPAAKYILLLVDHFRTHRACRSPNTPTGGAKLSAEQGLRRATWATK